MEGVNKEVNLKIGLLFTFIILLTLGVWYFRPTVTGLVIYENYTNYSIDVQRTFIENSNYLFSPEKLGPITSVSIKGSSIGTVKVYLQHIANEKTSKYLVYDSQIKNQDDNLITGMQIKVIEEGNLNDVILGGSDDEKFDSCLDACSLNLEGGEYELIIESESGSIINIESIDYTIKQTYEVIEETDFNLNISNNVGNNFDEILPIKENITPNITLNSEVNLSEITNLEINQTQNVTKNRDGEISPLIIQEEPLLLQGVNFEVDKKIIDELKINSAAKPRVIIKYKEGASNKRLNRILSEKKIELENEKINKKSELDINLLQRNKVEILNSQSQRNLITGNIIGEVDEKTVELQIKDIDEKIKKAQDIDKILQKENFKIVQHSEEIEAVSLEKIDIEMLLINNPDIEAIYYDNPLEIFATDYKNITQISYGKEIYFNRTGNNLTGQGSKICILDTGINPSVVLNVIASKNIIDNTSSTNDTNGHGTSVGYIIYENAPDAEIISGKVIGDLGVGYESDVLLGLDFCLEQNATIISLSIGAGLSEGYCDNNLVAQKVDELYNLGILVVTATGNDENKTAVRVPSCARGALAVGATNDNHEVAQFSNYNLATKLFSPGEGITTKNNLGNEIIISGTSISVPIVSAIASLVVEGNGNFSDMNASEKQTLLIKTGNRVNIFGDIVSEINLFNALYENYTVNVSQTNLSTTNASNETYEPLAGCHDWDYDDALCGAFPCCLYDYGTDLCNVRTGYTCRSSAGTCDIAEVCGASDMYCPSDAKYSGAISGCNAYTCSGLTIKQDQCNGVSNSCQSQYATITTCGGSDTCSDSGTSNGGGSCSATKYYCSTGYGTCQSTATSGTDSCTGTDTTTVTYYTCTDGNSNGITDTCSSSPNYCYDSCSDSGSSNGGGSCSASNCYCAYNTQYWTSTGGSDTCTDNGASGVAVLYYPSCGTADGSTADTCNGPSSSTVYDACSDTGGASGGGSCSATDYFCAGTERVGTTTNGNDVCSGTDTVSITSYYSCSGGNYCVNQGAGSSGSDSCTDTGTSDGGGSCSCTNYYCSGTALTSSSSGPSSDTCTDNGASGVVTYYYTAYAADGSTADTCNGGASGGTSYDSCSDNGNAYGSGSCSYTNYYCSGTTRTSTGGTSNDYCSATGSTSTVQYYYCSSGSCASSSTTEYDACSDGGTAYGSGSCSAHDWSCSGGTLSDSSSSGSDYCETTGNPSRVRYYYCSGGNSCASTTTQESDSCSDTGSSNGGGSCSAHDWSCSSGSLTDSTSGSNDYCAGTVDSPTVYYYYCSGGNSCPTSSSSGTDTCSDSGGASGGGSCSATNYYCSGTPGTLGSTGTSGTDVCSGTDTVSITSYFSCTTAEGSTADTCTNQGAGSSGSDSCTDTGTSNGGGSCSCTDYYCSGTSLASTGTSGSDTCGGTGDSPSVTYYYAYANDGSTNDRCTSTVTGPNTDTCSDSGGASGGGSCSATNYYCSGSPGTLGSTGTSGTDVCSGTDSVSITSYFSCTTAEGSTADTCTNQGAGSSGSDSCTDTGSSNGGGSCSCTDYYCSGTSLANTGTSGTDTCTDNGASGVVTTYYTSYANDGSVADRCDGGASGGTSYDACSDTGSSNGGGSCSATNYYCSGTTRTSSGSSGSDSCSGTVDNPSVTYYYCSGGNTCSSSSTGGSDSCSDAGSSCSANDYTCSGSPGTLSNSATSGTDYDCGGGTGRCTAIYYCGTNDGSVADYCYSQQSINTCFPPLTGTWNISCSENCVFTTNTTWSSGNVNITGNGLMQMYSLWNFTGTNQKVNIYSGCTLKVYKGGGFI